MFEDWIHNDLSSVFKVLLPALKEYRPDFENDENLFKKQFSLFGYLAEKDVKEALWGTFLGKPKTKKEEKPLKLYYGIDWDLFIRDTPASRRHYAENAVKIVGAYEYPYNSMWDVFFGKLDSEKVLEKTYNVVCKKYNVANNNF